MYYIGLDVHMKNAAGQVLSEGKIGSRRETTEQFPAGGRVQANRGRVKTLPEKGKTKGSMRSADCQVPQITGRAMEATPEALYELFRDWQ